MNRHDRRAINKLQRTDNRARETWLDRTEAEYSDALVKTLNENTAFAIAMTEYIALMRELRTAVDIAGDFALPGWLAERKIAGRLLSALNEVTNKARTIGLSLPDKAPALVKETLQIVGAVNGATEQRDLESLRRILAATGDTYLLNLFTETGKLRRITKEPLEDQWIGDQLLTLVGRHNAREAAQIIVDELENGIGLDSLTPIQATALPYLKDRLNGASGTFTRWASRLIERAKERKASNNGKVPR